MDSTWWIWFLPPLVLATIHRMDTDRVGMARYSWAIGIHGFPFRHIEWWIQIPPNRNQFPARYSGGSDPMSNLEAAKERLTEYVRGLVINPMTRLDLLKLQHMEDQIESFARAETREEPF